MRLHTSHIQNAFAKLSALLFSGAAVWLAGGCAQEPSPNPQLAGQVFVVLPDGANLRLGSVEVRVFDEESADRFIHDTHQRISGRKAELRDQLAELRAEVSRLGQLRVAAEMDLRRREAEVRAAAEELREQFEEGTGELRRRIEQNKLFIDNVESMPEAPPGIPTREAFQEFQERKNKWLSMNRAERRSWGEALKEVNNRLSTRLAEMEETLQHTVADWTEEIEALERRMERTRAEMAEAIGMAETFREEMAGFPDLADYLEHLPEPVAAARTDANGEFLLNLDRPGRHAVKARARRAVDGKPKEYVWFFWTEVEAQPAARLLFSNHNLITENFPENISLLPPDGDDASAADDNPA